MAPTSLVDHPQNERKYAPQNDLSYLMPHLIAGGLKNLEHASRPLWVVDLCDRLRITDDDLKVSAQEIANFFMRSMSDEYVQFDEAYDRSFCLSKDKAASVVVFASCFLYSLPIWYYGIRAATTKGDERSFEIDMREKVEFANRQMQMMQTTPSTPTLFSIVTRLINYLFRRGPA